jgi:hypothetical protein
MSSYCDISSITNSSTKIANYEKKPSCAIGSTGCLTDNELACYASYKLGTARKDLDASLANIYQPNTSKIEAIDSNYNATMLTGIIWAALGTTMLYYAFTKI